MARELGPAVRDLVAQHPLEERHGHVLEVGDLPLPLSVEPADEADPPVAAERHPQRLDQLEEQVHDARLPGCVALRCDVCGCAPRQPSYTVSLARRTTALGPGVCHVALTR